MEPNQHIREAVERLALARRAASAERAKLTQAKAEFDVSNAELLAAVTVGNNIEAVAERELRNLVVAHYDSTGETKPMAGAEIIFRSEFAIDTEAALAWARTSMPSALIPEQLNEKVIQKIAKASPLPFVVETKVAAVRIASDLDAALAEVASV